MTQELIDGNYSRGELWAHSDLLGHRAPLATCCHRAKHEVVLPETRNVGHTSGPASQSRGKEKDTGILGRTAPTKPPSDVTAWKCPHSSGCEGMTKGFLWDLAAGRNLSASLCWSCREKEKQKGLKELHRQKGIRTWQPPDFFIHKSFGSNLITATHTATRQKGQNDIQKSFLLIAALPPPYQSQSLHNPQTRLSSLWSPWYLSQG